eukprot:superscaffoldBa00006626_g21733
MNQKHLFCLLCFLVWLGQAQVPEPAQCLISGIYNLTQPPVESEDEGQCWRDCDAVPNCHMALIVIPLHDKKQCLLVNCLNQTRYWYTRHPSTEIRVYPKSTIDDDFLISLGIAVIFAVIICVICVIGVICVAHNHNC